MPVIRGLTLSCGYGSLLEITLAQNMRHLSECWVVTSPDDEKTRAVVESVPGARLFVTDAMFRHQALMNKGLCFEECWEAMGRYGMMWIFDADILFPPEVPFHLLKPNTLHGAHRRILEDPSKWHPDLNWRTCRVHPDGGPIGFAQIFSAEDPVLANRRPWYNVNSPHAGLGDAEFLEHWDAAHRRVLPFDVLHLGRPDQNWFGANAAGRDMMAAYVHRMQWRNAMKKHDPTAVQRVGEIIERVDVPGYETSTYLMPFEKRAKQARGR